MCVFFKVSKVQEMVIFSIFLVEFGQCLLLRDDDIVLYVDEERGVVGTVHPTVDVLTESSNCRNKKAKTDLVGYLSQEVVGTIITLPLSQGVHVVT